MEIRQASLTEYRQAAALAVQVWEGNDLAAMEEEFVRFLQNDETAVFLAWDGKPLKAEYPEHHHPQKQPLGELCRSCCRN